MAEANKQAGSADAAPQAQPGQVITPGSSAQQLQQPASPASPAVPPKAKSPDPAPPAEKSPAQIQLEESARAPFAEAAAQPAAPQGDISWTASEFIAHEKSAGWYAGLAAAAFVIAALIYLITRDIISTSVVLVAALALGIFGARKPHQLQYQLDGSGITIGQKHYGYETFRSFAIAQEGAFASIVFMPLKRFAPLTTIYYAPEDEEKIVDMIANRLPFEEHKADAVDSLMRRIRF